MKEHIVSRKNQIRSILFIFILMLITVVVIIKEYSVEEIREAVTGIHPFYLLAGIGLMFLYVGCQGMNFYLIMERLGKTVQYKNCIEYACIGNYFGAITPGASGGQPAQMYYMNKDRIHLDLSAITIFYMVFVSQIVIIVMGGVFTALCFPIVSKFAHWFIYLLIAGALVMLGLVIILSALMFSRRIIPFLFHLGFRLLEKTLLIKKPDAMKTRLEQAILSYRVKSGIILKHPDLFVQVFLVTVLQWLAYCMVSYLVYLSFGYRDYGVLDLMTGQSLINIAVAAVPLPGSVGVAEKAILNVFGQFYPQKDLPSAMILSRIINFYLPLLINFLVYLFAHHRMMKEAPVTQKRPDQAEL